MELYFIITCLHFSYFCVSVSSASPVMTQVSMDVGNIISIVIPETPDINIDQLTGDFRRQLEKITQQRRLTKLEYSLVSLKNLLPEMIWEEKKKPVPIIRQTPSGQQSYYDSSPSARLKKKYTIRAIQRYSLNPESKKQASRYRQTSVSRPLTQKYPKLQTIISHQQYYRARVDDESNRWTTAKIKHPPMSQRWIQTRFKDSADSRYGNPPDCTKIGSQCQRESAQETTLMNSATGSFENSPRPTEPDLSSPGRAKESPCSRADSQKIQSDKDTACKESSEEASSSDCLKNNNSEDQPQPSCSNKSVVGVSDMLKDPENPKDSKDQGGTLDREKSEPIYPINIEVVDLKAMQRIIENPQDILDRFNLTSFENNANDRTTDNLESSAAPLSVKEHQESQGNEGSKVSNYFDVVERNRDLIDNGENLALNHFEDLQTPKVTQPQNFDDDHFEIRIPRSVDANIALKSPLPKDEHVASKISEIKSEYLKPIKKKKEMIKAKESRKMFLHSQKPLEKN